MRLIGLEPTQLALLDPKSSASTNFATGAVVELLAPQFLIKCSRSQGISKLGFASLNRIFAGAKVVIFFEVQNRVNQKSVGNRKKC